MRASRRADGRRGRATIEMLVSVVIVLFAVVFCGSRVEAGESAKRGKRAEARAPASSERQRENQQVIPLAPLVPDASVEQLPNSPIPPPPTEVIPPAMIPGPPAEFADRPTAKPLEFDPIAVDEFQPWEQPTAKSATTPKRTSGKPVAQQSLAKRWFRTGGYVGLGVGVAALAVGGWQGSQSRIAQIDFSTARDQPSVFAAKRRGEVMAERANWWFIGGGALLGASAAVLVWTW